MLENALTIALSISKHPAYKKRFLVVVFLVNDVSYNVNLNLLKKK